MAVKSLFGEKCNEHPQDNPKGVGYHNTSIDCIACMERDTVYAMECKRLMEANPVGSSEEKGGEVEMAASKVVTRKRVSPAVKSQTSVSRSGHAFRLTSARGVAFDMLEKGMEDEKIVKKLVEKYNYTNTFAKSKLAAVKKIAGIR